MQWIKAIREIVSKRYQNIKTSKERQKKKTGSIYICQERSRKKHIEDISEYNKIFKKNVFKKEIVKFESENINQKEKKSIFNLRDNVK